MNRGIFVHLGALAVASVFAIGVWTREKKPATSTPMDVTVWSGKAADVERIAYEAKGKKVSLESKKDALGRYFVGTMNKEATPPPPPPEGAPPPEQPPQAKTDTALLSVGNAEKLAESLAPLKAFRNIGRLQGDRLAEFGLNEPDGTITVSLHGTEKKLTVGGTTPGGSDRYVRDEGTGEVFAIKGDIVRDLESADMRLVERDLHEWKDTDVATAKVTAGGKTRELVRGGAEGKKFWADAKTPDKNDETIGNWMSKVDRLRPNEFVANPANHETIVRIDYSGGSAKGYLELVKAPGASGGKPDYFIQTERTRQYAKVTQSFGDQVEQDVGSIVK